MKYAKGQVHPRFLQVWSGTSRTTLPCIKYLTGKMPSFSDRSFTLYRCNPALLPTRHSHEDRLLFFFLSGNFFHVMLEESEEETP